MIRIGFLGSQVAGKNQEMLGINLVKQKIIYSSDFVAVQLLRSGAGLVIMNYFELLGWTCPAWFISSNCTCILLHGDKREYVQTSPQVLLSILD